MLSEELQYAFWFFVMGVFSIFMGLVLPGLVSLATGVYITIKEFRS